MIHWHKRPTGVLITLLIWSAVSITTAQTSFEPVDDAYVEQGTHSSADLDKIHGTEDPDRLWVRAATTLDRKTYMKFDLTSLSGSVSSAVLEFTVDVAIGSPDVHRIHVHELDEDGWSEDELTGNNAPEPGTEITVVEVSPQASADDDLTYEVDLTEYINSVLSGDKIASLVFANPTAETGTDADQTDVRFFSSEATALGPGPKLNVTVPQTFHEPVDDAYVEQGTHSAADPDKIHGIEDPDRLWVRAATTLDRKTYMKFDLTDLSGTASEAVLEFTVDVAIGSADVHRIHVHELDEDGWSEDELTGNNAPEPGTEIAVVEVSPQASADDDVTYQVDLTSYINSVLSGDKIASLVFANPTAETGTDADQTDVRFFSSEATALGPGPQLAVTIDTGTSIDDAELPASFTVSQNYPNPFNPTTRVGYETTGAGHLRVTVFDLLGREVATLFDGRASAGEGSIVWDGRDHARHSLPTGLYVMRFEFQSQTRSVSMMLLR